MPASKLLSPSAVALVLALVLAWPTPAAAQQSVRDVLLFLLTNRSIPTDDFVQDASATISTAQTISEFLVAELGTAASGEPMFGWAVGGEVRETYVAVGWDFELGRGWNITPKLGFTNWELQGGDLENVVDGSGQLRDRIDGEDAYLEVAVTKHLNSHVGLGFSLRHAEVEFGQVSSAAFRFVWSL